MILSALLLAAPLAFGQGGSPVAGGVVSSKEWRVKRGAEKEEEFTGDVRYRTGPSVIRSDWALYKHEAQTWRLRGRVRVDRTMDSGDKVQAAGDDAFLRMKDRSGWLTDKDLVTFRREPADGGGADEGHGRRLEWQGRDRAALIGEARLWGPRLETWSDRIDYDDASGEILLSGGRPVLRKYANWSAEDDWTGALKGDRVRAWQARRALAADGGVVGWLEFKDIKGVKK